MIKKIDFLIMVLAIIIISCSNETLTGIEGGETLTGDKALFIAEVKGKKAEGTTTLTYPYTLEFSDDGKTLTFITDVSVSNGESVSDLFGVTTTTYACSSESKVTVIASFVESSDTLEDSNGDTENTIDMVDDSTSLYGQYVVTSIISSEQTSTGGGGTIVTSGLVNSNNTFDTNGAALAVGLAVATMETTYAQGEFIDIILNSDNSGGTCSNNSFSFSN